MKLQKCVYKFFKKREQFTDYALVSNKTKRDVVKLQPDFPNTAYFFHGASSLTLRCLHLTIVYRDDLSAITKCILKSDIGNQ